MHTAGRLNTDAALPANPSLQGAFDLIGDVELDQPKVKDIIKHLEEDLVWISENRAKVTGKLQALDNILQELEGVYLKALYKLRNLK